MRAHQACAHARGTRVFRRRMNLRPACKKPPRRLAPRSRQFAPFRLSVWRSPALSDVISLPPPHPHLPHGSHPVPAHVVISSPRPLLVLPGLPMPRSRRVAACFFTAPVVTHECTPMATNSCNRPFVRFVSIRGRNLMFASGCGGAGPGAHGLITPRNRTFSRGHFIVRRYPMQKNDRRMTVVEPWSFC